LLELVPISRKVNAVANDNAEVQAPWTEEMAAEAAKPKPSGKSRSKPNSNATDKPKALPEPPKQGSLF
jgi:hypothetical protein